MSSELILKGNIVVLPTNTVYGLAARAADILAVRRLYGLKDRHHKPGTIVAANLEQLAKLGLDFTILNDVKQFWPGAVSVVVPADKKLDYLHQGLNSLAVRIPADKEFRDFLMVTGPLLTSSANLPGEPTANTVEEAKNYFGDQVDWYVDGGDLSGRLPSALVRFTNGQLKVLRGEKLARDLRSNVESLEFI